MYKNYNKKSTFSYSTDEEIIEKMKYIARKENKTVNRLLNRALIKYIEKYECEYGEITKEEIELFKENM